MDDKQMALTKIKREIEECQLCKKGKIGKIVFGEGNPDAKIMFIGEAPGREEAKTGRPFIGRSGKLLRSLIASIGISEKECYITSPVKYLPESGTPTQKDIKHARFHFQQQIAVINPRIIVLLGAVAVKAVLQETIAIKKEHGRFFEKDNRGYFITFHPAAALRFPPIKKILHEDFEKLHRFIPKTSSI